VFIPTGAGGIGTFAIQLAKYLGAKVATTTSAGNVDLVRSLRPVIDKVFPFDQAREALAYLEMGRAKGKVVVQME
jgi:NADPH:quinone reductase-like Zn-dependent oxidoreductase